MTHAIANSKEAMPRTEGRAFRSLPVTSDPRSCDVSGPRDFYVWGGEAKRPRYFVSFAARPGGCREAGAGQGGGGTGAQGCRMWGGVEFQATVCTGQ